MGKMGDIMGMMKALPQMKAKMEEIKENLGNDTVEASVGGEMVTVTINGKLEILDVKIDPEVIDKDDPGMLQTLVQAGVNEAIREMQDHVRATMQNAMAELGLPSMPGGGGLDLPGF